MALLVRIEGVDFAYTIDDTNDLSTQRGAGLAYLAAPRALIAQAASKLGVVHKEVFTAASIGVYWLETTEDCRVDAKAVESTVREFALGRDPDGQDGPGGESGTEGEAGASREESDASPDGEGAPSGTVADAWGASEGREDSARVGGSEEDDLEIHADEDDLNLWERLCPLLPHLNFAVVAEKLDRCPTEDWTQRYRAARLRLLARVRKAQLQSPTVVHPPPEPGKWQPCRLNANLPASGHHGLSLSVWTRRRFGRKQKRAFYKDPNYGIGFQLGCDRVFARDLEDLVRPKPAWVKDAIRNKVAHFYLDGNDFTKIREGRIARSTNPFETEQAFSKRLKCLRGKMLREVLDRLAELQDMTGQYGRGSRLGVFRWETLLWGADEAAFVMPAWVALFVLRTLAGNFELPAWEEVSGERLTHKIGIYIANRKTPVAVARRVAAALADSAKQGIGDANVAQIMITESAAPPMDITNIGPDTLARYRVRYFGCGDPAAFTINLDELGCFMDGLRRVKAEDGGLPRSQLYGLLRDRTEQVGSCVWRKNVLDAAFTRSAAKCRDVFENSVFGAASGRPPLLPFMRVVELLDYYCPETLESAS